MKKYDLVKIISMPNDISTGNHLIGWSGTIEYLPEDATIQPCDRYGVLLSASPRLVLWFRKDNLQRA